jgi:putative phosphoesterase
MKILIVSDSHGKNTNLKKAVANMQGTHDRLIHLGDSLCSPETIEEIAGCPVDMVRGNCDSSIYGVPLSKIIEIEGYRILLLHGHQYAGISGLDSLRATAKANDVQIVMCGHTHVPLIERGEVTIVNPGSISQPRQEGHIPTYLVMNIENGQVDFVPVHLKQ